MVLANPRYHAKVEYHTFPSTSTSYNQYYLPCEMVVRWLQLSCYFSFLALQNVFGPAK